jgi:hypothetical protein
MLDVFRFAWFAVRTFFGIGLLILAVETSMWMLLKVHSMGNGQPGVRRGAEARQLVQRAGNQA